MEILIPITFFAMIAAIVVLPKYFRARSKQQLMETLQAAYEKGQPVPPELIESLSVEPRMAPRTPRERADKDLRGGIITLAIAIALVVFGWALSYEEDEALYIFAGLAAFPGLIGLALIAFGVTGRGKSAY
jgi:Na+/H+ antiporter NhaD/arsenite permease-like protein